MYEEEEEEKLSVTVFVNIELVGVERQIAFATFCNTTRTFTIGSFHDNEHYSYLEALLIQNNPKEDSANYSLHARIPAEWKSERKKILQKVSEYSCTLHEDKLGKGEVQGPLSFLLRRPVNMYTKELEGLEGRMVLQKLLSLIGIERDPSNKGQFELKLINLKASMMLDKATINALQIFGKQMEKKLGTNPQSSTLFDLFNKCKTAFGTRCLKRWMKQPLQSKQQIQRRLDQIQFFITQASIKNIIQNQLKKLPDLDRLYFVFYKVAAGKKVKCEVSDLIKIYRVVESLMILVKNLSEKDLNDPIIVQIYESIQRNVDTISRISKMIEKGIDMSGTKDSQFYVRPETQQSLMGIMKQKQSIEKQINEQVFKVAKHLNLQVEKCPSNTHKYVLQANKKMAINKVKETEGYKFLTAKQTKITFITNRLSKLCEQLRMVEEQYKNEQQVLLKKMFELVAGYYPVMEELSLQLSQLDVVTTVASTIIAANGMWARPRIGNALSGIDMRHPIVKNCVPNNCDLRNNKTIILTGPNMGGKSTYIRTVGICTYLAHLGFYVPAVEFETPVVDAIITRVGASDLQVRGISTFMSEMLQSSCMLQTASSQSLVLIDELGRGTSTTEGFGIAWGICEYLHREINPYCLFATHFHEMTRMASQVEGVKNMFTSCRVQEGSLVLQYKVEEGKMQKSYGIEVMKMLDFPQEVVETAEKYLECYEYDEVTDSFINSLSQQTRLQVETVYSEMQSALQNVSESERPQLQQRYARQLRSLLSVAQS